MTISAEMVEVQDQGPCGGYKEATLMPKTKPEDAKIDPCGNIGTIPIPG